MFCFIDLLLDNGAKPNVEYQLFEYVCLFQNVIHQYEEAVSSSDEFSDKVNAWIETLGACGGTKTKIGHIGAR